MREQRIVLEDHGHATILRAHPAVRIRHDAVADRDLPRIGTQVPGDDVEQRRLATTRGPEDGDELATRNDEIDAVERGHGAELAADSMKAQCDRLGHEWKGTLTPAAARGLGHASRMSAWQNDGNEITGKVLAVASVFAILALVMGFAIGMFLGRSTAPDLATLAGQAHQSAAALSADLAPAQAAYAAAVPSGSSTLAPPSAPPCLAHALRCRGQPGQFVVEREPSNVTSE